MSDSLWPHELQHTRLLCPSLCPWVSSNWYPLSQWYHPTISSSFAPFSPCPQFFLASGSFTISQFFASGGQSIGAKATVSVLPMSIQGWFPLGLTGLISLHSKGLSRVFSNTTVQKHQFFSAQLSLWSNSHIHAWLLKKTIALTMWTFVSKVISQPFKTLSRFDIAILSRSKCLSISWLQSLSALILEPKKMKSDTFYIFPICLPWSDGPGCPDLSFLIVEF